MELHVKATRLDLTPSINAYLKDKIGSLAKFLKEWDKEGTVKVWVEIGRTTKHHHKGPVFRAKTDVYLPKKVLRAEHEDSDVRIAIDKVRGKLLREISTYKEKAKILQRKAKKTGNK